MSCDADDCDCCGIDVSDGCDGTGRIGTGSDRIDDGGSKVGCDCSIAPDGTGDGSGGDI